MNPKFWFLIAAPVLGLLIPQWQPIPDQPQANAMLGIALWMALWWIGECVPLAVTALLPLILFPLLGVAATKAVAPKYFNSIIFLFLGGFLIAQAMERTGLHRRIALKILARWHHSPLQLATGFAVATAFLSMWISNTATTMLMVTIAIAVIRRLEEQQGEQTTALFSIPLLLVIPYAANLGGMGTPVGTAPNLVFLETLAAHRPELIPTFLQWMMIGVPVMLVGLGAVLLLVGRKVRAMPWSIDSGRPLRDELASLGPIKTGERKVAIVLTLTALAWMTRSGIKTDDFAIPGWTALLPYPGVDDGTVSMFGALSLFLLRRADGAPILDSSAFGKLPWGIVLLLGGGFALAMGMQDSGLSHWLGGQLQFLQGVPLPLMLLGVTLVMVFLTEITSNTAITQVMLPILAAVAATTGDDPIALMLVATLAASCAFMLPVATPPNAIAFGTERLPMQAMIKAGVRLNFVMTGVIVVMVLLLRGVMPGG
ncbi:MAG: hypothetical protein COX57_02100 [Alphaproteobacteria bacterium CG_4_10_14_0_2_um_filter_63_37]|nr:MAG: hypothetical protein COX57_02100 [Alphaproteobacteria bacterium CG_4_10_14_0_2_um_filter_63_37]